METSLIDHQSMWTQIAALSASILTGIITLLILKWQTKQANKKELLHKMIVTLSHVEGTARKYIHSSNSVLKANYYYHRYSAYWNHPELGGSSTFNFKPDESRRTVTEKEQYLENVLTNAVKEYQYNLADLVQYMTEFSSYLDDELLYTYIVQLQAFVENYFNSIPFSTKDAILNTWNNPNDSFAYKYVDTNLVKKILDEVMTKVRNEVDDRKTITKPFGDWKAFERKEPKVNY